MIRRTQHTASLTASGQQRLNLHEYSRRPSCLQQKVDRAGIGLGWLPSGRYRRERGTKTLPVGIDGGETWKRESEDTATVQTANSGSVKEDSADPDNTDRDTPGGPDAPKYRRTLRVQEVRRGTRLRETVPLSACDGAPGNMLRRTDDADSCVCPASIGT